MNSQLALLSIVLLPQNLDLIMDLLRQSHGKYHIIYGGYRTNHLSHGLYSFYSLGASRERLIQFYDLYTSKLEPLPQPRFKISRQNWTQNIGTDGTYSEYLDFFDKEIAEHGFEATFHEYFGKLMGFSIGGAMHPLIYIGYALEFHNPLLLSEGFALSCVDAMKPNSKILETFPNSSTSPSAASKALLEIVEDLRIESAQFPPVKNGFHVDITKLLEAHEEMYTRLASQWDLSSDLESALDGKLNELTEVSLLATAAAYPDKIDFFLLHGATMNHAVRVIFPLLSMEDKKRLLHVSLIGVMSAYTRQQYPKLDVSLVHNYQALGANGNWSSDPTWEEIVEKTIVNNDVHNVKVVRTLLYYAENVPETRRSKLFGDNFIRKCAFKMASTLSGSNNYITRK